jgi:hypothetical protein
MMHKTLNDAIKATGTSVKHTVKTTSYGELMDAAQVNPLPGSPTTPRPGGLTERRIAANHPAAPLTVKDAAATKCTVCSKTEKHIWHRMNPTRGGKGHQFHPAILTVDQTDEMIRNAANPTDGAIEDCEESPTQVLYFFASGTVGKVDRRTGAVKIDAGVTR